MPSNTYIETGLLERTAAGDQQAFAELVRHWQPFLYSHIFQLTKSRELTEEIVQDVFMKVWKGRANLGAVLNFRTYLLVVSRNAAIDAVRKVARDFRNWEKWVRENGDDPGIADTWHYLVDEAIDRLTPRQKEIYLLQRHEKLTYQEIADKLGIGRETVKTHLESAVKHISTYIRSQLSVIMMLLLLQG